MAEQPQGCIGFLVRLFGGAGGSPAGDSRSLPEIQISRKFPTDAEADFFRVLRSVIGERGHILVQVSLRQLLYFPGNRSTPGRNAWQNKVAQRSVDFLICHPATLKPIVAVELDEPSHATPKRQTKDEELEAVLQRAGLPLERVLTSRTYDTRELAATFLPYLEAGASGRKGSGHG